MRSGNGGGGIPSCFPRQNTNGHSQNNYYYMLWWLVNWWANDERTIRTVGRTHISSKKKIPWDFVFAINLFDSCKWFVGALCVVICARTHTHTHNVIFFNFSFLSGKAVHMQRRPLHACLLRSHIMRYERDAKQSNAICVCVFEYETEWMMNEMEWDEMVKR